MSDTQYDRRLLENAAEGERKFKKSGILTDLSVDEIEKLLTIQYGDIRGGKYCSPERILGRFHLRNGLGSYHTFLSPPRDRN